MDNLSLNLGVKKPSTPEKDHSFSFELIRKYRWLFMIAAKTLNQFNFGTILILV